VRRAHLGFGRSVVSEIYGAHSVRRSARGAAAARVACNKRRLRCVWSVRDRSQEKIGAFHSSALNTVPKTPHAWRTRNSSDVAIRHLRSASASASGSASGPRPPRRPRRPGVRSHCRFRSRGTDYVSEAGVEWMNGGAKRPCLSALCAHTKAQYKTTDLLWETLRALKRPGRPGP
jgi:hypothetical protein